jgi:arginyl-tRNA synthetase
LNKIEELLAKTIKELYGIDNLNFTLQVPRLKENGDLSSTIALQLAKKLNRDSLSIANEIGKQLYDKSIKLIEVKAPGFINFFLKQDVYSEQLKELDFSFPPLNKKYNVEFVSANPTGDLHLGHARQAALGDSICRLLSKVGYQVTREYYVNDAGNQMNNLALSLKARYNQIYNPTYLMLEDGYHGDDIKEIAQQLNNEVGNKYLGDDTEETLQFFKLYAKEKELIKINEVLQRYRVSFDVFSSEVKIRDEGYPEEALKRLDKLGLLYENEGATFFKTTVFGDDKDRVVIKSDGNYTYLTPDIAYHIQKLSRGYDYLIDLLGADHHGYINRMKAAIQALTGKKDKLHIEIVQMVRLIKDGQELKMSKRTGNAISINDLIDEVGVDAARFFFVMRNASSHLDFDINLATSQSNDNPVYYIQYAHARICQILNKNDNIKESQNFDLLINKKEIELIKSCLDYKDTIQEAADSLAPYKIVNYLLKLAQLFHSYYADNKVNDPENIELSASRLGLCRLIKNIVSDALLLIGVEPKERM